MTGGENSRRVEINLAFHALLAQAAKNPVLVILVDALIEVQSKLLQVLVPTSNSKVILSRRRLLKHLRARDEEAAVREMQIHLTALQRHYMAQEGMKQQRTQQRRHSFLQESGPRAAFFMAAID